MVKREGDGSRYGRRTRRSDETKEHRPQTKTENPSKKNENERRVGRSNCACALPHSSSVDDDQARLKIALLDEVYS